ncbi:MAG: HEAT repeat domain-containing protein [Pyrinomonadaceae bacterium]
MKTLSRSFVLLYRSCILLVFLLTVALSPLTSVALRAQTNRNSKAQPSAASAQKRAATLHANDSAEGSRVSISSEATLDDYEAYRRGDRFYVKLPGIDVSQAQAKMRARGFGDVSVQKSGGATLLSFHMQPGTIARVDQRGSRLEVVFTIPGGKPGTPLSDPTETASTNSGGATTGGLNNPGSTPEIAKSQTTPGNNSVNATAPATSGQTNLPTTPTSKGVNQGAANSQTTNDSWLGSGDWRTRLKFYGEMARLNWLPLVIGLLVLLLLVAFLLSRRSKNRRRKDLVTLPKKLGRKETSTKAVPVVIPSASEQISGFKNVKASGSTPSVTAARSASSVAERAVQENVDVALVQAEATSMLAGAKYDNNVTGTVDSGARDVIATELLSALAGRNPERQERAREAFIKSGYFDDATRDLRVAEAPAERASAARKLALVRDREATPHLIAALEDEAPEVRRAAVEALADLRDPAAITALNILLSTENNRKVPHTLIRHAIEVCATGEPEKKAPASLETESLVASQMTSAPIEPDREVIEI